MSGDGYNVKFFSSNLGKESAELCLSMFLSDSTFMYAISTDRFATPRELCHVEMSAMTQSAMDITQRVTHLVNNYMLNQKKFAAINISILNQDFTLLPEAYAGSAGDRSLLEFSGAARTQAVPQHHSLNSVKFCYTIRQDLLPYLERTFPTAAIRHAGAVSISSFFSQFSLQPADLYMHVTDGFLELSGKQNNSLLFYNVFQYSVSEDVLYYLLFTMEQFSLNPLNVKLVVASELAADSDLVKSLKRYIRDVQLAVRDSGLQLKGELRSLPGHYYFTLFHQHLCAL